MKSNFYLSFQEQWLVFQKHNFNYLLYIIVLKMSEKVYIPMTPKKKNSILNDYDQEPISKIYLQSLTKQVKVQKMCLLCLQYSSDCDSIQCNNPSHVVCKACNSESQIDQRCPVCKNDTRMTIKKNKKDQNILITPLCSQKIINDIILEDVRDEQSSQK